MPLPLEYPCTVDEEAPVETSSAALYNKIPFDARVNLKIFLSSLRK
jgi:hypothetical protein